LSLFIGVFVFHAVWSEQSVSDIRMTKLPNCVIVTSKTLCSLYGAVVCWSRDGFMKNAR